MSIFCFCSMYFGHEQRWESERPVLRISGIAKHESIDWRIRFKLSTLIFKALHTGRQNTSPIYCTSVNPLVYSPQIQPLCWHCAPYKFTYYICALPVSFHSNISTSTSQPFLWLTRFPYFCIGKKWNTLPLEVRQSHYLSHLETV